MSVADKLSRAKTQMVLNYPFFATIALNMDFIFDDTLNPPTAATNGKEVRFHPDFVKKLSSDEMIFLVCHEVMHPVLDHISRRGNRDPMKWNIAADIVVNQILTDDGVGRMPACGIRDLELFRKGGGLADTIYNLLPDPPEGQKPGDGSPGSSLDNLMDAPGDASQKAATAAEWRVVVAQASRIAEARGKLSANLKRFVNQVLHPKVDWRDVLRRFVEKQRTDQRTYSRPNRRFATMDIILPSVSGETMGDLVVAIDCSGSVGRSELSQFTTEVTAIHADARPKNLHVIYFDSEVCGHDRYEFDETPKISAHGGGGTAFSPIFRFIDKQGIDPVACVVLTDLYCSDFGDAPGYPVLWVSYGSDRAPWGEVIGM